MLDSLTHATNKDDVTKVRVDETHSRLCLSAMAALQVAIIEPQMERVKVASGGRDGGTTGPLVFRCEHSSGRNLLTV